MKIRKFLRTSLNLILVISIMMGFGFEKVSATESDPAVIQSTNKNAEDILSKYSEISLTSLNALSTEIDSRVSYADFYTRVLLTKLKNEIDGYISKFNTNNFIVTTTKYKIITHSINMTSVDTINSSINEFQSETFRIQMLNDAYNTLNTIKVRFVEITTLLSNSDSFIQKVLEIKDMYIKNLLTEILSYDSNYTDYTLTAINDIELGSTEFDNMLTSMNDKLKSLVDAECDRLLGLDQYTSDTNITNIINNIKDNGSTLDSLSYSEMLRDFKENIDTIPSSLLTEYENISNYVEMFINKINTEIENNINSGITNYSEQFKVITGLIKDRITIVGTEELDFTLINDISDILNNSNKNDLVFQLENETITYNGIEAYLSAVKSKNSIDIRISLIENIIDDSLLLNTEQKSELKNRFNEYIDNLQSKVLNGLKLYHTLSKNNNLTSLDINGITDLDLSKLEHTIYVGNNVTNIDLSAITADSNAIVQIIKPETLAIGKNEIKIIITAPNGEQKIYTIIVIREDVPKTSNVKTTVSTNEEYKTVQVVNNDVTGVDDIETKTDDEKKYSSDKEYDEELEEEGLSPFTIVLIVGGIALIGLGIYMLFGDKEEVVLNKNTKKTNTKKPATKKTDPRKTIKK